MIAARRCFAHCSSTTIRTKRIIVLLNFNTDVSNFWEFSATVFSRLPEANEAYKLGVNYLVYALTH